MSRREEIKRQVVTNRSNSDDDSEEENSEPLPAEPQDIPMPEIPEGSEYLVAFLHSAGTATATGMGLTSLSWQEIDAWVRCTDNVGIASPRDLKLIHLLSRAYTNEYHRASKKGVKPPYEPKIELAEETREVVSKKADDLFESLMAFQSRK